VEGEFSRLRLRSGVDVTVVVGFVLDWWEVVDAAVEPHFVEPVDPAEGGELEVVDPAPGTFVADAFGLVQPDVGLGERVIGRSPRRFRSMPVRPRRGAVRPLEEPVGVADRRVLGAGVATTNNRPMSVSGRSAGR